MHTRTHTHAHSHNPPCSPVLRLMSHTPAVTFLSSNAACTHTRTHKQSLLTVSATNYMTVIITHKATTSSVKSFPVADFLRQHLCPLIILTPRRLLRVQVHFQVSLEEHRLMQNVLEKCIHRAPESESHRLSGLYNLWPTINDLVCPWTLDSRGSNLRH